MYKVFLVGQGQMCIHFIVESTQELLKWLEVLVWRCPEHIYVIDSNTVQISRHRIVVITSV